MTSLLRVVIACAKHDSCLVWEDRTMKESRCLIGWHRFITRSEDGTGAPAECSRCGKYMPDSGSPATPGSSLNLRVSVGVAQLPGGPHAR